MRDHITAVTLLEASEEQTDQLAWIVCEPFVLGQPVVISHKEVRNTQYHDPSYRVEVRTGKKWQSAMVSNKRIMDPVMSYYQNRFEGSMWYFAKDHEIALKTFRDAIASALTQMKTSIDQSLSTLK